MSKLVVERPYLQFCWQSQKRRIFPNEFNPFLSCLRRFPCAGINQTPNAL